MKHKTTLVDHLRSSAGVGRWTTAMHEAADLIERQAAQIEMMREFIARAPASSGVCCCGEAMDNHSSPMNCGHTPVDLWDHSVEQILSTTPDQALKQFAERVREYCAEICDEIGDCDNGYRCAKEIRSITELPK